MPRSLQPYRIYGCAVSEKFFFICGAYQIIRKCAIANSSVRIQDVSVIV